MVDFTRTDLLARIEVGQASSPSDRRSGSRWSLEQCLRPQVLGRPTDQEQVEEQRMKEVFETSR
ncbi:hypothetical protein HNQ08_004470 [Deinococcus humi]|uniref:Uncharacterized protein n=1 Tax=Deinococcus humi TaxID=662880 RepID=A0A7W8K172_9DEIO|nr:hypothetical protein [Deinococcus humi]